MNVLSFTGNLGRDASTNSVNGTAVANFPVAMKAGYGQNEQTVWVDCALWGKRAESGLIQYLTKGKQVAVTGEIGTREYQAKDGTTRTAITCRVNDVTLMGDGGSGGQQRQAPQQPADPRQNQAPAQQPQHDPGASQMDDEIPFMRWPNIMGG